MMMIILYYCCVYCSHGHDRVINLRTQGRYFRQIVHQVIYLLYIDKEQ
jgi:hypothetical protein